MCRHRAGTRPRRSRSCLPCGCPAAPGRAGARAPAGWRRRRCRRRSPRSRPASGHASPWPAPAGRRPPPGSCPWLSCGRAVAGGMSGPALSRNRPPGRRTTRRLRQRCTLGGRSSHSATTSSPSCASVSVALRRGSSARTRPRPDTPPGTCARLKPRQPARVGDVDAHAPRRRSDSSQRTLALRAVLDGIGQQFVEGQRDRDRLGLGQQQRAASSPATLHRDRAAEGALHRRGDGLAARWPRAAARRRPPAGRRPGRWPAPGPPPRSASAATSGWRAAFCCSRPATPCRLFLMRWCTSLHQHLALRDGGLQARLLGGALLGHVAGHQQQLRRRAGAGAASEHDARVPDARAPGRRRPAAQLAAQHLGWRRRAARRSAAQRRAPCAAPSQSSGVRPSTAFERPAEEGRRPSG